MPEDAAFAGFALAIVVLVLVAGMSFRQFAQLNAISRDAARTGEVIGHVEFLVSAVKDADARARAFIVSGDPGDLAAYRTAAAIVPQSLATLGDIVADVPAQADRMRLLEEQVTDAVDALERAVAARHAATAASRAVAPPSRELEHLRETAAALAEDEAALLEQHEANRIRASRASAHSVTLVSGGGLALIIVAMLLVRRSRRQQRRAIDALEASEERLRLAIEAAHLGTWEWDVADNVVRWSSALEGFAGLSAERLVGSYDAFLDLVHPEDRPAVETAVTRSLHDRAPYDIELRTRWDDGRYHWLRAKGCVSYDASGRPVRMAGVMIDVGATRRAAEERERLLAATGASLALLETVMATSPVGIAFLDRTLRFVRINEALAALAGRPVSEHVGRRADDVAPPVWGAVVPALERVLATGEPLIDMELSAPPSTSGSEPRHALASCYPVRATDGALLGVGMVAVDVSERRRVEAERAASANRLQAAHDIATSAVSRLGLDELLQALVGRLSAALATDTASVLLLTREGRELRVRASHGLESDEATGVTVAVGAGFAGRIAAERRPFVVERVDAVDVADGTLGRRAVSVMGTPLVVGDRLIGVLQVGTVRPRRFTTEDVQLLELVAARVASSIEVARLYEAERRARASAEEANRAKDDFLGTLSHELRSPLSAIRTWVHLLRRGKLDGEKSSRALATIEESVRTQSQLIEDLLDVSRIVAGKLRMEARRVDLAAVVEAATDTVRLAAEAKDIRLSCTVDPRVAPGWGDAGRLQQVVWNLLANAIKFTPRGGKVDIRLARGDGEALIVVRDTGQGIRADFLPHLFERFRQADSSSTRRHGGLGLGLAIVRHIVELHGGRVGAESDGEGHGARFTVRLPLAPATAKSAAVDDAPSAPAIPLELRGVHVLLVDDERPTLDAVAAVLEECGAQVTTAVSVADAVRAFRRSRPTAVVSDIAMPEEDGYALIRRLRALEDGRARRTPALALTAYASADDRRRALLAGYDRHVPKPVDPPELIAAVIELVSAPEATAR